MRCKIIQLERARAGEPDDRLVWRLAFSWKIQMDIEFLRPVHGIDSHDVVAIRRGWFTVGELELFIERSLAVKGEMREMRRQFLRSRFRLLIVVPDVRSVRSKSNC